MIDEAQKAKWDNYAIHKAAVDSGLAQGLAQGSNQKAFKLCFFKKKKKLETIVCTYFGAFFIKLKNAI